MSAPVSAARLSAIAEAARDPRPVSGCTHNFYKYPARFSPEFARAAIAQFSKVGDVIADPYMGGGTTIVEGLMAKRRPIGNDLNSLAVFVTRVKTTPLSRTEVRAIRSWADEVVPGIGYDDSPHAIEGVLDAAKMRNLTIPRARFIKKFVAGALLSVAALPTDTARRFARCAVLRAGQWALDGRRKHTALVDFRERLGAITVEMLVAIQSFATQASLTSAPTLYNLDASHLHEQTAFKDGPSVSLVVTSPPYPGVHMLYHRWQVDGRKETPAPYWIAGCDDGKGATFYNFGDRRDSGADRYFAASLSTLHSIRRVMKAGAHMVQLIAFNRPEEQLPRYLSNMAQAGFSDLSSRARIWRDVPNRKWHASLVGRTHSAREVVLVHRAV